MTPQRRNLLLGLLALLAALRFVLVPIITWQSEAIASNERLASKLEKSRRLLKDQGVQERIDLLQAGVNRLEAQLPTGVTDLELQVQMNSVLASSLTRAGLQEVSRAWSFGDQTPRLAELRLGLRGHFYDLVQWLHQIESLEQPLQIAELQINRVGNAKSGEVSAALVVRQWILPQPAGEQVKVIGGGNER